MKNFCQKITSWKKVVAIVKHSGHASSHSHSTLSDRCHTSDTSIELGRLGVLIKFVGPVSCGSDVQPNVFGLFWRGRNAKRMPLVFGNGRNVDIDVVTGLEAELWRLAHHQMGHLRG
jgi:hypothetical protein